MTHEAYESSSSPEVASSGRVWRNSLAVLPWLGLGGILAVYIFFQACIYPTAYTEQDCDAYLILAKRMANLQPLAQVEPDPYLYQAHMWVENDQGQVTAKFAPGYPLMLAIAYRIGGDDAMILVSPIMGGLAVVGLFMLVRLWTDPVLALLAAATLAVNYPLNYYGSYFLTHATMTAAVVWGMYFLWRWLDRPTFGAAIGAGLTLGFAALVRHTGGLLCLAVGWAVVAHYLTQCKQKRRLPHRSTLALLGAYLLMLGALAVYNWMLFGGPATTGYALTHEQAAFQLSRILPRLPLIYHGYDTILIPFIFPVALIGLLVVGPWPRTVLRLLWIVPPTLLYASYYWLPDHLSGYRFLLNVVPLVIAMVYLLIHRAATNHAQRWLAGLAVLGLVIAFSTSQIHQLVEGEPHHDSRQPLQVAQLASDTFADNAVVFSQWPFVHYVGTRRHWQLYDLSAFDQRHGRRTFRIPQGRWSPNEQPVRLQRLHDLYENTSPQQLRDAQRDIVQRALSQHRQVAYLFPTHTLAARQRELGPHLQLKLLAQWESDERRLGTWGLYAVEPAATDNPS